jgi:hypothetical protein
MAVIDVGPGATDRASSLSAPGVTFVDYNNAANDTGILDTFEVWLNGGDSISFQFATFSSGGSGKFTARDTENIGTIAYGSKQTITGKNCDVVSGDYLGAYIYGTIERTTSGLGGVYYLSGLKTDGSEYTFSLYSGDAISIYATGATAAAGNPYYYYLQQ